MSGPSTEPPRSLYVHAPFCERRCSYCDFAVEVTRRAPTAEWVRAMAAELALQREAYGWPRLELDTVYVGGGTPSLLGVGAMACLRDALAEHASWDTSAEWTAEANPESFDLPLARDWAAACVNRISLGVQTFAPAVLRWMGRLHGADAPARAVLAARKAGIDNLSVDLIFGVPERFERRWSEDLERTLELEPDHVSLYGLTAEPGAPLGRWVREQREALPDEDRYADEYLTAVDRFIRAGFEQYEVSSFARPGARSRHNAVYWSGAGYAALGPGAHAYDPPRRRWNLRGWDAYRETVSAGTLPLAGEELVGTADRELEDAWLALRTRAGYPVERCTPAQDARIDGWVRAGWARRARAVVRLTPRGWLLLDTLAVELVAAGDRAAAAA